MQRASSVSERMALDPIRPATRVVLAEDDDEMRTLVAQALREAGASVEELASGRELLARLLSSAQAD